ncbi:sigma-54 interaction domain-containing protein [Pseudoramibacter sp.]|jgi:arginine utilization regulatory protein|uniref:sigma-54 interaction domain-containing protein n=1 Tax=Pseudoramibacter sp. TaxID=2034862 RepID=UPI0025E78ACB|nr:sigma 54-interacting transcriptional regulator [Pseudoramibacter sp.]MCH4072108.1 sigma 54-interacting transcriptional regulator [Pseudoramibacter sp.]MCH4105878.1 sigma 54-interacting transcriptional regulator [Pseudoramibacter sp.]
MDSENLMNVLSACRLGAVIVLKDETIYKINDAGVVLLKAMPGDVFPKAARPLLNPAHRDQLVCMAFERYITACDGPKPDDLPKDSYWLVFRDGTLDYERIMMRNIANHLKEGVVMCDAGGRLNFFNASAVTLDNLSGRDVVGKKIDEVYQMDDNKNFMLVKTMKTKKPILKEHHRYTTQFGHVVNTMADAYPVVYNKQVIGAFNLVEDWSKVSNLNKKIIDLQEQLIEKKHKSSPGKAQKKPLGAYYTFDDIIYSSEAMHQVVEKCRRVAKTDASVMIYGETGTGKELVAQSLHNASLRSGGPFLAINCAALPENLFESLLFGSVKGAYTGAENRPGLFEQANHGSLLLDEINSMDILLQAKLLRVLQDGVIRRVGSETETRVDVRVITCINIPPTQAIAEGKLRQDLFYRLGVINIELPPLRDRGDDIALLTQHFIMAFNQKNHREVCGVDEGTDKIFNSYSWPGNVRELQHAVEQALILLPEDQKIITADYVSPHILRSLKKPPAPPSETLRKEEKSLPDKLKHFERDELIRVLSENNGNITKSARVLNMSRQNLQYRIKRYHIDVAPLKKRENTP